jgi:predicted metal-dependent HD superfamily phosphohydrolase
MLQSSWERCWSALGASSNGTALMQRLVSAYEEPHRKYHTVQHLSECLSLCEQHLDLAVEPSEVEIALWFHDAIYDIKASDNEARSADWAQSELSRAGVAYSIQRLR